jgi:hypothetical protein
MAKVPEYYSVKETKKPIKIIRSFLQVRCSTRPTSVTVPRTTLYHWCVPTGKSSCSLFVNKSHDQSNKRAGIIIFPRGEENTNGQSPRVLLG